MALATTSRNKHVMVDRSEVDRTMKRIDKALDPRRIYAWMQGPLEQILQEQTDERFADEQWSGGPWPALKPRTEQIRQSLGFQPDHPINVRYGELFDWLTENPNPAVQIIGGNMTQMTFPGQAPSKLEEKKLSVAQKGARPSKAESRGAVPARPVLELSGANIATVLLAFNQYLDAALSGRRWW